MSRRVNVLFLIDYFHRTGGTEQHLAQLVQRLPRAVFKCSIVAFDLGANLLLDQVRESGIPVIHVPVGREYVPSAWIRALQLAKLFRTLRPDIVQTFHQKSDTYGAVVARLSGVKHIVSSKRDTGALRAPRHFFLNRRLRNLFEKVIVVADAVGTAVMATDNIDRARIVRIYNGVDIARFTVPSAQQRRDARTGLGFAADDFVVGIVARFRPEKNHDVFFAGLLQAAPSIPSLKVLAVGAGPLLAQFRERITQTELGARTVFAGDVSEVVPCLWAMDVGCLTSSYEGFSNAVVEQMAVGLPMLVTNVGGNPEAVVDGENGRVIPPQDVAAFSRALIDLHDNRAGAVAMGRASRTRVEERFSLERMCAEHVRLYLSMCDPSRLGSGLPARGR